MASVDFCMKVEININGCRHSEEVEVCLQICEQAGNHAGCTTLKVVYEHGDNGKGWLKISNECQKFFFHRMMEGNMNQIGTFI